MCILSGKCGIAGRLNERSITGNVTVGVAPLRPSVHFPHTSHSYLAQCSSNVARMFHTHACCLLHFCSTFFWTLMRLTFHDNRYFRRFSHVNHAHNTSCLSIHEWFACVPLGFLRSLISQSARCTFLSHPTLLFHHITVEKI